MEIRNYCPECKNLIGATKMAERCRDDAEKLLAERDEARAAWERMASICEIQKQALDLLKSDRDRHHANWVVAMRALMSACRVICERDGGNPSATADSFLQAATELK